MWTIAGMIEKNTRIRGDARRDGVAGRLLALAVVAVVASALAPDPAAAASRPDLIVTAVEPPPERPQPGTAFPVRLTVRNRGRVPARASVARLVASADTRAGRTDPLLGRAKVGTLRPRQRRRVTLSVTVASQVHLVVCADARRRIRESREDNNCRASAPLALRLPDVVVPSSAPAPAETPTPSPAPPAPGPIPPAADPASIDSDGDGTADVSDCGPFDAGAHPGAPDAPDDFFVDSNCDGVDGTAATSVFVAPGGSDNAAGTREAAMATIGSAIQKAQFVGRSSVLVRAGTYNERVVLAGGISLYGGYGAGWNRSDGATTTIMSTTPVAGDRVVALEALNVVPVTRVERFRIETGDVSAAGVDSYAVRVVGSPGLRLEDWVIVAGDGGPGAAGSSGADGLDAIDLGDNGQTGWHDWNYPAKGGAGAVSPVGANGGAGGAGVYAAAGATGSPGVGGAAGGPGGPAGDPGQPGQNGHDGADGATGTVGDPGSGGYVNNGLWFTGAGGTGKPGGRGGGGGGQTGAFVVDGSGNGGGGGGAGGGGGTPGGGATGGGASFGIFAVNSTGMTLTGNTIQPGHGGMGGAGGFGGFGGSGTPGGNGYDWALDEIGIGGDGGHGGDGGKGGRGGGGAGGPSFGIFRSGTTVATGGNNVTPGVPGAGGAPNGFPGQSGALH